MTVAARDVDALVQQAARAVTDPALHQAVSLLVRTASPPGGERPLADSIAAWGTRERPRIAWTVDALDTGSANLFARSTHGSAARELVLYGHLDTSLTGRLDLDVAVTGEILDAPPLRFDERTRTFRGFGVGVAKAPSAGALVAFLAAADVLRASAVAHRLTLLLAAGGTHRAAPSTTVSRAADPFARGVRAALARGWRPTAVLNAKGGAPGVMHEEPGAAFVRVRLRRPWSAALARRDAAPDGGLARHAGAVIDGLEAWRDRYLAAHRPAGQVAPEVAVGAIRSGLPEKADLMPGSLEVFLYVVLMPDDDGARIAEDVKASLAGTVGGLPGRPTVDVEVYALAPGGSTNSESEIVRLATRAFETHVGATAPIRGWSGATDGAVFQHAGIATVRMGPAITRDGEDPRVEIVSLDDLAASSRAIADVAVRYFASPDSR